MKPKYCCLPLVLAFCFLSVFPSCDTLFSPKEGYEPTYMADSADKKFVILGVPNLPYYELLDPVVGLLNRELKTTHIKMIAGNSYSDFLTRLNNKEFDLAIVNGVTALESQGNGYNIVAKVDGDEKYKGIVFVHTDSMIRQFRDLKGKTVASPGKESLAGYMMPALMLRKNGIDVNKDIRILNVVSFESAILNVYHGKCSAGFAWLVNWENFIAQRPELASGLTVKWTTPSLPNVAVLFSESLSAEVGSELKKAFLNLHLAEKGSKFLEPLGVKKFVEANEATYQPVKHFLEQYESAIK